MRFVPLLIAAAFLISGCHSPEEPLPYPITLTEEGLGAVRIGDPYEIGAIQSKLPGFTVEKMSRVTPERSETLLLLKRGERVLAHIFPGNGAETIGTITLCTDQIQDMHGQRVGTEILAKKDLHCNGNSCHYGTDPSLHYLIDPKSRIVREITLQKL